MSKARFLNYIYADMKIYITNIHVSKFFLQKSIFFVIISKYIKFATSENAMSQHATNLESKKRQASFINPNINDEINEHASSKRSKLKATTKVTSKELNKEQSHNICIEPQVSFNFSISDMYVGTYVLCVPCYACR